MQTELLSQISTPEDVFIDALCDQDTEALLQLQADGLDINFRDAMGYTPSHIAVNAGCPGMLSFLLKQGADPNAAACDGSTPLNLAIAQNSYPSIRVLAVEGADLTRRSDRGWSYLDQVYSKAPHRFSAATALLDSGVGLADLSIGPRDKEACRWYHWIAPAIHAAGHGDIERLRDSLEQGVDPNTVGYWPLILAAAQSGNAEKVRLLIAYGASPDTADEYGQQTALHAAAFSGYREIVRDLIAAGADLNKPTRSGEKPIDAARRRGYPEIARDLLEAGANPEFHRAAAHP